MICNDISSLQRFLDVGYHFKSVVCVLRTLHLPSPWLVCCMENKTKKQNKQTKHFKKQQQKSGRLSYSVPNNLGSMLRVKNNCILYCHSFTFPNIFIGSQSSAAHS